MRNFKPYCSKYWNKTKHDKIMNNEFNVRFNKYKIKGMQLIFIILRRPSLKCLFIRPPPLLIPKLPLKKTPSALRSAEPRVETKLFFKVHFCLHALPIIFKWPQYSKATYFLTEVYNLLPSPSLQQQPKNGKIIKRVANKYIIMWSKSVFSLCVRSGECCTE